MRTSQKLVFLLILFAFFSCNQSPQNVNTPNSTNKYIYAFTAGAISKADPIRIRFSKPVITADQIGQLVEGEVLSFSPKIPGKASWEDEQSIFFEPAEWLNSSTTYKATVDLKPFFKSIPRAERYFEFNFQTKDQFFQIDVNGIAAVNASDLKKQKINGVLSTSDVADPADIEAILNASQSGRNLEITWQHSNAQNQHYFTVNDVNRGDQASSVNLSWDGRPIDVQLSDQRAVEIPSLSDFKIMQVQVARTAEQYFDLQFSDPLNPGQDVNGLISVSGFDGTFRYIIDGNSLKVYPSKRITGERTITINPGIRNINNYRMQKTTEWKTVFEDVKPQVRLVGKGVIVPNSEGLVFPFEAIGLNAVEVEIFKIYDNNILQFLQTNDLDGNSQLYRVGRIIERKKIDLNRLGSFNGYNWTRYAINLEDLITDDPDAIYQIRLGFRPEYANYDCSDLGEQTFSFNNDTDPSDLSQSVMDSWYGINGYYNGYEWAHRSNPCFPAYYNSEQFVRRNVLASNLGIIAKAGEDKKYFVAVNDLRTANAVGGATIEFYDFQQQQIATATTNNDGTAVIQLDEVPSFLIAEQGQERGYLRLQGGSSLSLSRFDVAGVQTQEGLKGYMYGERGVWRPGDSVYLHFVLNDESGELPEDYPIEFELYDARGQLKEKRTSFEHVQRIYPLHFATDDEDPTGDWMAKVKAGGANFDKVIKIETIKPNRLKINLSFGKEELSYTDEPVQGNLQVNWLHGAPAKNVKTIVEANLQPINTTFPKYSSFEFDDPARSFYDESKPIFEGNVNETGGATFSSQLINTRLLPGKLRATFKTRAFEPGGNESTDNFSISYYPFEVFTGIEIPRNQYDEKRLTIDENTTINIVSTDKEGQPAANRKLSVGLYRVEWRWWWDRSNDNVSRYNSSNHVDALETYQVTTNNNGAGQVNISVDNWGRYMIRVCDDASGHCTGDFFYAGYPWYGESTDYSEGAAMLAFSADKEEYQVGEEVKLTIPTGKVGKALVTLENGTTVLDHFWQEAQEGENVLSFKTTEEMAPTVYAHVELIQPHAQAENDLPIRLYGVIPINVVDTKTKLEPVIAMADELEPSSTFKVEVNEASGQPMGYHIAVVDEGLLGLTRFKTPNPWDAFFAKEALGVKTWDVYDQVLGAYGGELERLLSMGGDEELIKDDAKDDINRFKPVVMHLGPFFLERGRTASHTIEMPNYVGAVRTMVIAANARAYGSTEKMTPVKKPLMVLATLPRVLGPGETFSLPVSVFAMDNKVKRANITLKESSGLASIASSTKSINFSNPGDQVVYFDVTLAEKTGKATFTVEANGNGEQASQEIEIEVRNPNPYVTEVQESTLQAGGAWTTPVTTIGMPGTNSAILEVSSIPPIDLGRRLDYLIRYPYGCIEQTLSGGFPQLYLSTLLELNEEQKTRIPQNIRATINRLRLFQTADGGFAYWPGGSRADHWSTSYAGHFLLEAQKLGYTVPPAMLSRWINFQKQTAQRWNGQANQYGFYGSRSNELSQSYRLFTLALANEPDLGRMNSLRTTNGISPVAKWRLASAYALAGNTSVAKQLVQGLNTGQIEDYNELSYTYGSTLRDRAMVLETMVTLEDANAAANETKFISEQLNSQRWLSTQTTAFCLLAIGKYVNQNAAANANNFTFEYKLGNKAAIKAGSNTPIFQIEIPNEEFNGQSVTVNNTTGGVLFAKLYTTGQPLSGNEVAGNSQLEIAVDYKTIDGSPIDVSRLEQGTDFVAEVTITNPGTLGLRYEEMALSQIFPSGWEIINSRMDGFSAIAAGDNPEYQDIRDDRVNTFFDVGARAKKTFKLQLNAAYIGEYYLPAIDCQAMYNNNIFARTKGQWVSVVRAGEI